mmetsp:Transcript_8810/g.19065  ORF Transcript_8810/g.19065 Transcript_8810/m.19065 type:complete len:207 (+) Transcript_8810:452-1072(+)
MAPPIILPRVTGSKFFNKNVAGETAAPFIIPRGMRNMFATECSRPRAAKAEIGNQIATILPPRSLQKEAMYTAMHTNQLHKIPRTRAALKESPDLAAAIPTEAPPPTSVPPAVTMAAMNSEPTKFPLKETIQDLSSCGSEALPSSTAAVTRAVLPVKSSAPVTSVIIRPNGRPNAPKIIFWSPGFVAARPGHAPPTETMRKAPKAM